MEKQLTIDEVKQILDKAKGYLEDLKSRWNNQVDNFKKKWFFINHKQLKVGFEFILQSLDELVNFVEQLMPEYAGKDKKAIVVMVIEDLFDYVIQPALPIGLKFLVPKFKQIVIEYWIGNLIDFIVSKYNTGLWIKEVENEKGNEAS